MHKTDIAWLAGIIDGEGCIMLNLPSRGGYHTCKVSISNTNEGILNEVERILRGWLVFYTKCTQGQTNRYKQAYQIEIQRQMEAVFVLQQVLPYLKSSDKREKALRVFEYMKSEKNMCRSDGRKPNRKKKERQYSYI